MRTYLDHLTVEKGLAINTLTSYRRDLNRYLAFLAAAGVDHLADISEATVAGFLVHLREGDGEHPPLSATSAARTVVAVRGFHKFAVSDGLAVLDPAAAVKPPTPAKRLPKALPLSDVEAILEAAGAAGTALALRDRALLEVLYGTGARISEAVGLDVDDIDRGESGVDATVLLRGKGGKQRIVPMGSYAREAVDAYLVRGRTELVSAASAATPREPAPGGLLQRPGRPPLASVGLGGPGQGRRSGRGHPRRVPAHAAALLRHPPARRRRRRTRRAGAPGPRLGDHDPDLHARHGRQPARGLRDLPPPGTGMTTPR